MYSGSTLTKYSGRILGAHQKIDRIARKHLDLLISDRNLFPQIKDILLFEGKTALTQSSVKARQKMNPGTTTVLLMMMIHNYSIL
jgi:hypothetical protein